MDDRPDAPDATMELAETGSDAPTIYERDVQVWRLEQAELLRLRRFAQADLPNIVEELESMGRSLKSSLRSSYRPVIAHLLKWQYQNALRLVGHLPVQGAQPHRRDWSGQPEPQGGGAIACRGRLQEGAKGSSGGDQTAALDLSSRGPLRLGPTPR